MTDTTAATRTSRGSCRRALTGLAVIAACAVTSWTMTAAPVGAAVPTVTPATLAGPAAAAAKAPCIVTGYTLHAEQQMAARNISSDYVENVVYDYCARASRRTSNNTWQYTDGKIVVSANDNGYVVTVIRR